MASRSLNSNQKLFAFSLILLSLPLIILVIFFGPKSNNVVDTLKLETDEPQVFTYPRWFDLIQEEIQEEIKGKKKIKVGLVNFNDEEIEYNMHGLVVSTVHVRFNNVSKARKWEDFFPEWIDEDHKSSLPPTCPEIPMPRLEDYRDLHVVVARVPCEGWTGKAGFRDVFRLQVNLVVANLLVGSGWVTPNVKRAVYAVFVGGCGPMPEIFRCDDLLRKVGDHWVYMPELRRLKQKVLMPLGSCQIAPPHGKTGKKDWRYYSTDHKRPNAFNPREAYVTDAYVCGAIALAQSIIQSNSNRDLLLLHDEKISPKSLTGLKTAGWKIRQIGRIRNPFAKKNSFNESNYSKLRIWLLTWYDKVVFIDADVLVFRNLDRLFVYPQLSAASNDRTLFNSGIMVIEPSLCMFEDLKVKSFRVDSHNGGDQGFLNEVFTWWHRLPTKVNFLKCFEGKESYRRDKIPDDVYAIHYLGLKPWMCYRDYDCNWDMKEGQVFASDKAHEKWWQFYDAMPEKLQQYCWLTEHMKWRINKGREIARNLSLPDEHWKNAVTDPRQYNLVQ
ncbi:putative UDP-glucuronate:xylan alpha-glucuronosyltransferase 4 [Durio zibethinus]|uniref:Hexosyltransferase n=1 Tax=Durio zibethinus TaxID=66656 RepID=A0A6P5YV25_DURZI|nr:putative UDP-glucuronate:xylan alpha-glucuronosyltransferase 4 [Durio zibethinus]